MNHVSLIGRLVRDPDIRYTQGQEPMCIAKYTLAVDRRFKRDGEASADFISCVSFGKSGEFVEKYLRKGSKIAAEGRWQTGSYKNKEGQTIYKNDCVVDNLEFAESKQDGNQKNTQADDDGFMKIPDGIDEQLPFN